MGNCESETRQVAPKHIVKLSILAFAPPLPNLLQAYHTAVVVDTTEYTFCPSGVIEHQHRKSSATVVDVGQTTISGCGDKRSHVRLLSCIGGNHLRPDTSRTQTRRGPSAFEHMLALFRPLLVLLALAVAVAHAPGRAAPACVGDKSCVFTAESLAPYDGRASPHIFISIVSYVFDVTKAKNYYGPDGTYPRLGGREISKVMATMDMDDVEVQDLTGMSDGEWNLLFDWVDKIQAKYTLIGRFAGWRPGFTMGEINKRSGFSFKPAPPALAGEEL